MQMDFHYYATYCAAYIAGYSHAESMAIGYSSQFVDCCARTLLSTVGAPLSAATTQLQLELMNARTDIIGLQDITRIWSAFHFLPYDLKANPGRGGKLYRDKYRLICGPNGALVSDTVELAKGGTLEAVGVAMHIVADTWAHRYFAGTPSMVINNTDGEFYELLSDEDGAARKIRFRHNPTAPDDLENGSYTNSVSQMNENSIMNLGHGRAGHLPDYSFVTYRYMPAWGNYSEVVKDNPSDYYHAFCQMIYALKYLRGQISTFETGQYDFEAAAAWQDEIYTILRKRQLIACDDWKAFGEKLSGQEISDFDTDKYIGEYKNAKKADRNETLLGKFILAALAQKSMVTNRIFKSGNMLSGFSVEIGEKGFRGIRDFKDLVDYVRGRGNEWH